MKSLLVFFLSFSVLAQSPTRPVSDFKRAYQDYLFNFNQYRQFHQNYSTKKQAHLNYQTLRSKSQAENATQIMLKFRDEVIRTYLTALRLKFAEITKVADYQQNVLYLQLDKEVFWYSNHQNLINQTQNLEKLVSLAAETEEKYQKTEVLVYQTLGTILIEKEVHLEEKISTQIDQLSEKIEEIKKDGSKNTARAETWLVETKSKLNESKERQNKTRQMLAKFQPKKENKTKIYQEIQNELIESHQALKTANSYLLEIIQELKTAD